jgi:hypothetical protein
MGEVIAPKRTRFLAVICALSTANSVYGIVSGLLNAISPPEVDQKVMDQLFERLARFSVPIEGIQTAVEEYYLNLMLNMGNLGAASFLFFGINLVGVMLMLRLNRIGFVLYLMAQLGLAFTPVLFGGFNLVGQISLSIALFWNGVWIAMYATQLKYFYK